MILDARHLNFTSEGNHLSVSFSVHARASEFKLTDEQVVLLWEQLGERVAKLARRRVAVGTPANPVAVLDEIGRLATLVTKEDVQRYADDAQRKSWVVGEMMLQHPEMTRERAAEIYDSVVP